MFISLVKSKQTFCMLNELLDLHKLAKMDRREIGHAVWRCVQSKAKFLGHLELHSILTHWQYTGCNVTRFPECSRGIHPVTPSRLAAVHTLVLLQHDHRTSTQSTTRLSLQTDRPRLRGSVVVWNISRQQSTYIYISDNKMVCASLPLVL